MCCTMLYYCTVLQCTVLYCCTVLLNCKILPGILYGAVLYYCTTLLLYCTVLLWCTVRYCKAVLYNKRADHASSFNISCDCLLPACLFSTCATPGISPTCRRGILHNVYVVISRTQLCITQLAKLSFNHSIGRTRS